LRVEDDRSFGIDDGLAEAALEPFEAAVVETPAARDVDESSHVLRFDVDHRPGPPGKAWASRTGSQAPAQARSLLQAAQAVLLRSPGRQTKPRMAAALAAEGQVAAAWEAAAWAAAAMEASTSPRAGGGRPG